MVLPRFDIFFDRFFLFFYLFKIGNWNTKLLDFGLLYIFWFLVNFLYFSSESSFLKQFRFFLQNRIRQIPLFFSRILFKLKNGSSLLPLFPQILSSVFMLYNEIQNTNVHTDRTHGGCLKSTRRSPCLPTYLSIFHRF